MAEPNFEIFTELPPQNLDFKPYAISDFIPRIVQHYVEDESKEVKNLCIGLVHRRNVRDYLISKIEELNQDGFSKEPSRKAGEIPWSWTSIKIPSNIDFFTNAFPAYNVVRNNRDTIKIVPDNYIDSKQFIAYAIGNDIAELVKDVEIVYTPEKKGLGLSLPIKKIFIDPTDPWQGDYNPKYDPKNPKTSPISDVGRIGLEIHELWHQVQYKQHHGGVPFLLLGVEQAKQFLTKGSYDPYNLGDPTKPGVLNSISALEDIESLEGRAQFVGQWAADLYSWQSGYQGDQDYMDELMPRLKKEAGIILRSGYKSRGANDILLLDDGKV